MKKSKKAGGKEPLRRFLRGSALVLLLALISLYVLMPAGVGLFALMRHPSVAGDPPDGFQSVHVTASDGVELAAWHHHGSNDDVILVLHGATASRAEVRPVAEALAEAGFGVLAPDLRGHGESGGRGVPAYGWRGTEDVKACLAWIDKEDDAAAIGGYGASLGGEILLGASSDCPEIQAIVADGATYRSLSDYLAVPSRKSLWRSFTTRLLFSTVRLFGGEAEPKRLFDAMATSRDTAFLLIEAGSVTREAEYGDILAASAPDRVAQWLIPGIGHVEGHAAMPDAYEEKILTFLTARLGVVESQSGNGGQ